MKKKALKKQLSIILTTCFLASALNCVNVFADKPTLNFADLSVSTDLTSKNFKYCGINYKIIKEAGFVSLGEVAVTNNHSLMQTEVSIPDMVTINGNTYLVTSIDDNAFYGNKSIESITIGKNVNSISSSAFINCINLKKINVSEKNKAFCVKDGALYNLSLTNLIKYPNAKEETNFTISEKTTSIDDYAFNGNRFLTTVNLSPNVKNIGDYAFTNCQKLSGVLNATYLESIGNYAFAETNLKDFTFSRAITKIGDAAFLSCSFSKLELPGSIEKIGYAVFYNCQNLKSIKINSASSIGSFAFGKTGLTSIELPSNLKTIESSAFSDCTNLEKVYLGSALVTIGPKAFYNCESLKTITIPNFVTEIGDEAFSGCHNLSFITVAGNNKNYVSLDGILYKKGMQTLVQYPCAKDSTSFTIPSSLTNVVPGAIANCRYLTEFVLDDEHEYFSVNNGVLFDYSGNKLIQYPAGKSSSSYNIPDNVRSIEPYAFAGSIINGMINIPSTVKSIGEGAFNDCNYLYGVYVDKSNRTFISEDGILYNTDKTKLIQCPINMSLTSFTVPSTVTEISDYAFYGTKLNSIELGSNVKEIGNYAFCNSSLKTVSLNEGLEVIGDFAFTNTKIENIVLPESLVQIGGYAFEDCSALKNVTFNGTTPPSSFGENIFSDCGLLTKITVPTNFENIYTLFLININVHNVDNLLKTA